MWSAEAALNDLWAGLDVTAPAGDVRAYLKKHLEAAHEADRPDPTVQLGRRPDEARRRAGPCRYPVICPKG